MTPSSQSCIAPTQAQWPMSPVLDGRIIGSYGELLDFLEAHSFPQCVIVSRETFHVLLRFALEYGGKDAIVGNTVWLLGTVFKTADKRPEILDLTEA